MGSSFLNAPVNAFQKLYIVRAESSGGFGMEVRAADFGQQAARRFQFTLNERFTPLAVCWACWTVTFRYIPDINPTTYLARLEAYTWGECEPNARKA